MACIYESTAQKLSSNSIQNQLCNILKLLINNKLNCNFTFFIYFFNTAKLHIDTNVSVVSVVLAFSASARARAPSAPTLLP